MERKTYLGRYLITLDQYGQPIRLRRDGSATTYKAFDKESNREVALEIIPAGSVRISVQSKLEEEAEAAKRLQQINVPMLYDFGIENNELIYATELVDGVSAQDWVTTHGAMPMGPALRIASQVVKALSAATFHSIFHHALNPANIMIVPGQTAEGEWPLIKVMKFVGLAPKFTRSAASDASVSDKTNFVAPEQLETGNATFASEIYSLGCTLWFLLTGAAPAEGAVTVANANRVPAPVRELVSRMLAIDPDDRPRDPVVLHEQIEDCIAEVENKRVVLPPKAAPVPVAPVPVSSGVIDARPRRPFPWQPLAVAAVLLLLGGIAALAFRDHLPFRTTQREIGVPVGVPEPVANAAARPVAAPPASVAQSDANTAAPGVLTSTATTEEEQQPTNSSEPAQVASSDTAPTPAASVAQPTAAPVLASNSAEPTRTIEPEPPSEGPQQNATSRADEPATTTNEEQSVVSAPTPAPTVAQIAHNDAPPREETKPEPKATPKPVRKTTRSERAVASAPRMREGRVRAQYLGTTPEGEMVFGLPADERGYLDPNTAAERRNSSGRRRKMEVRRAEPVDELPVLPALPPDSDD
jgi:serine/threonine-protein kinase